MSCPTLPWDLVPPLVALGFWAVGMAAWILGQQLAIVVFFFFISSASLSVGLLSGYGNDLAGRLFYIFLAWLSPVLFQFHFMWAMIPMRQLEKAALAFLYLLACMWSVPFGLNTIAELQDSGWFPFLRLGVRFTIAMSLIGVIILLIGQFRRATQSTTRYRIRLVFSGAVLSFVPLLLLSLLPSLLGKVFIPFEVNFVWLLFIPLSYGYSITNKQYLGNERAFSRIIVYYLAAALFTGGYLIIADIVSFFVPDWTGFWAWAIAGMGMAFLFLIARVNQIVRQIANWILYGSEKSHLELLIQMTNSLGPVLDREKLRQILVDELATIIPSAGNMLFLKMGGHNFVLQGLTGFDWQAPSDFSLPENGALAVFLKAHAPIVENRKVRETIAHATLVPEEIKLLAIRDIGLWIPMVSGDVMHGLLVLGCKPGGVLFNGGDQQVWLIFARQVGVAAHNLLLTEYLQTSRKELARAHQQLLYAREQERRQLARELHDNTVQQLLGISYQVITLQHKIYGPQDNRLPNPVKLDPGLDALRQEILRVTTQLREMIGELRPAGLEDFGIGSVLESFVHKLQRQAGSAGPQIEVDIEQNDCELSEPVRICLFRVSQEALRNTLKHAVARHIQLHLYHTEGEVVLEIHDDGCGFTVPERLSELTQSNHYGLIGIAERVAWVNGRLEIRSRPGQGTNILVWIPI
jgi:signal transduction histidine kinase